MRSSVPRLPQLDDLVASHTSAHRRLADELRAAAPHVQSLFRFVQRRLVIESLANAQPTLVSDPAIVFPTPRSFLGLMLQRRMIAISTALRHIDARRTMRLEGLVEHVVVPSTPFALHALLEASNPSERETNPGMLRATPTNWVPEVNPFVHAPGPECAELVDAAIDMAGRAPAAAVARAGWLTFTLLSIHPFVDGNGRTSRMLFHAIAADELELGFDWGIAEQWSLQRVGYIDALKTGQRVGYYDPDRLDPQPFMRFSAEASTAGARLCAERVRLLQSEHRELVSRGFDPDAAMLLMAVRLNRIGTLGELGRLGLDDVRVTEIVEALTRRGILAWVPRHAGWRTMEHPDPLGLAVVR